MGGCSPLALRCCTHFWVDGWSFYQSIHTGQHAESHRVDDWSLFQTFHIGQHPEKSHPGSWRWGVCASAVPLPAGAGNEAHWLRLCCDALKKQQRLQKEAWSTKHEEYLGCFQLFPTHRSSARPMPPASTAQPPQGPALCHSQPSACCPLGSWPPHPSYLKHAANLSGAMKLQLVPLQLPTVASFQLMCCMDSKQHLAWTLCQLDASSSAAFPSFYFSFYF